MTLRTELNASLLCFCRNVNHYVADVSSYTESYKSVYVDINHFTVGINTYGVTLNKRL